MNMWKRKRRCGVAVLSDELIITPHACKRMKERLGLGKKAAKRNAQIAYDKGMCHAETRTRLKRYLDKEYLEYGNANNMRVYGEHLYLFRGKTLITIYQIPRKLRASSHAQR